MFARRCRGESCASAWGQAKLSQYIYTACAGKCKISGYSRQYRRVIAVGRERQTQDTSLFPVHESWCCASMFSGRSWASRWPAASAAGGCPDRLHTNVRGQGQAAHGKISPPYCGRREERHAVAAAWQEKGRKSGASPRASGTSLRSCRLGDANVAFNRKKAICTDVCPIEFPPIRHSDGLPAKLADAAAPLRQAQARIVAQRRDLSTPA